MREKLIKLLVGEVDIFTGLSEEDIELLLSIATEERYKKDDVIFREGDKGMDIYIIEEGTVRISKGGEDGRERTLLSLREGQVFGEMSLIDKLPRSATVTASSDLTVLKISKDALFNLQEGNSGITLTLFSNIAHLLSIRLRKVNERLLGYLRSLKTDKTYEEEIARLYYL